MSERKPMARRINLLISLIIAFSSWFFVVYTYAPVKTVTYKNVPISYIGTDELANRGLAISSASENTLNVTLKVKRTTCSKITAGDIAVQADVSSAVKGDNGVSLIITPPGDSTLVRANISSVSVNVESGSSKTIPVSAVYSATETDFEPVPSYMSSEEVSVFGAKSQLKKIHRVEVKIPYEDSEDEVNSTYSVIPVDEMGNEVYYIVTSPEEISLEATKGTTKAVLLKLVVRDLSDLDKTYDAVDRVVIKGPAEVLDKITEVKTKPIDLTFVTSNMELPITLDVPEGVMLSYKSAGEMVKITVEKK